MAILTNEELAEVATVLLAQVDRADLKIAYAGNGWFHRLCQHTPSGYFPERRKDVERTVQGLHKRIKRDMEERPAKERTAYEERMRQHMLSEALTQYVENANEPEERTDEEAAKVAAAEVMLDQVNKQIYRSE